MGLSANPGETKKSGWKPDKSALHPCSYRNAPLDDKVKRGEYIENIVNCTCEHICRKGSGEGGCLKFVNGKWKCSRGFPKKPREKTTLIFEK
jgi:hypothetical protein